MPCSSRTRGAHPRNALRVELTAELAARRAPTSSCASRARGETPLERLVSLVLLGDLVSLYLAVLRGVDPVDIAAIDALKAALRLALRRPGEFAVQRRAGRLP